MKIIEPEDTQKVKVETPFSSPKLNCVVVTGNLIRFQGQLVGR